MLMSDWLDKNARPLAVPGLLAAARFAALGAFAALAGCSQPIEVRVSNRSSHPVHDVRVSTMQESLPLGTLHPGDSLARKWRLQSDEHFEGEFTFTFRHGSAGADSIHQRFGYIGGVPDEEALHLTVHDTTYTIGIKDHNRVTTVYSMRSGAILSYRVQVE